MESNDELHVTTQYETKIKFKDILETYNLAELMSDRDLQLIGELCLKEKEEDEDSRQDWKTVTEDAMNIISPNILMQKTTPWIGCADVKLPLLSQAIVNAASRMLPALVHNDEPVKPCIFGLDPDGSKQKKADNVKTYMTWQLVGDPASKWKRDFDKSLSELFLCGTMFRKCYYDQELGIKKFEMIPHKDIIVNRHITDLTKAQRISQNHIFRQNDIETRIRTGKWIEYNYQKSDGLGDEYDTDTDANVNEDTYNKTYSFTEQHRWLDLDNDGYAEPYIVYVDNAMKQAVCINRNFDIDESNYDPETGQVIKLDPNQYYIAYHLIPSFDGSFYSYGFAYLFLHINSVCNSIINIILDSGSLVANGGGFISKGARNRAGTIRSAMNEWHTVDNTPGTTLKENIVPFPNSGPPMVLMELLQVLMQAGKELSGMTDVLTGEMPSRELPAQTMFMLIDEVTKPFSAIHGRIYDSLKEELQMLFLSDSINTDNDQYQAVLGDPTADYTRDFDKKIVNIIPGADPNAATTAQQQTKLQILATIPGIDQYQVSLEQIKSLGYDNPDKFLPKPQPPPPSLEQQQFEFFKQTETKKLQQKDRELDQKDKDIDIAYQQLVLDQVRAEHNALKIKYEAILNAANAQAIDNKANLDQVQAGVEISQSMEQHEVDKALSVLGAQHAREDVITRRMAAQQNNQTPNTPPQGGAPNIPQNGNGGLS